jgi:hypothetical protein
MPDAPASLVVIASASELPLADRVWGHGGWMMPEEREALDWLTFGRLLGWSVAVARLDDPGAAAIVRGPARWIVVACDPNTLPMGLVAALRHRLEGGACLVVTRAGLPGGLLASLAGASATGGQTRPMHRLAWCGPGQPRNWHCGKPVDAAPLDLASDAAVWATLDGVPVVSARRVGQGRVAMLGFHPGAARDQDGAATALLRHLLVYGAEWPVAWLDWEGTMVLRMDDPGGAQNVFNRTWCYPKLGEAEWEAIGTDLARRDARISLAYVSGWTDGDARRGRLFVQGQEVERVPGRTYPSPHVVYEDLAGHRPGTRYDTAAEFLGIRRLRAAGLAEVELHGHTHMSPDTSAWAAAADRYETVTWFRELGGAAAAAIATLPAEEHPLACGIEGLRQHFGVMPTTLISPGDQWTTEVLEMALDLGIQLVDSYYLALRDGDRFWWSVHVCAPYLDLSGAGWFAAGLPVVGYFHDKEPAEEGVGWMSCLLDAWQEAGARRFIDFRELAGALGRRLTLEEDAEGARLVIRSDSAPALVRPLPIRVRTGEGAVPHEMRAIHEGVEQTLPVTPKGDGEGLVLLPA